MNLADLLKPSTKEDFFRTLLSLAKDAGFPVEDWQEREVARKTLEVVANALSVFSETLRGFASSAFLSKATGDWLTVLASEVYGVERGAASRAFRTVLATNNTGGNWSAAAYSIVLNVAGTDIFFTNTNATGTIADGASVTLSLQSMAFGTTQNSTTLTLDATSGLAANVDLSDSIITSTASDVQRDESLVQACLDKWALVAKATDDWYAASARAYHTSIKKVSVARATPNAGDVTIYIANASGPSVAGTAAALEAYLDPKPAHNGPAGWADNTYVLDGTQTTVNVAGTVTVLVEEIDAVRDEVENELLVYAEELPMGATVQRNEIIEIIMRAMSRNKANKLSLTFPASDEIVLSANQYAVFSTASIAWSSV